eukprot:gene6495-7778_t
MLRRVCTGPAEIDDVVQETCYRILSMASLDHVRDPKPFVFRAGRIHGLSHHKPDPTLDLHAIAEEQDME